MNISIPILIVGPSGSGKSSSLENLDPAITVMANIEQKPLPFKKKFPGETRITTWQEWQIWWMKVRRDEAIKIIVIESITALNEMIVRLCKDLYKTDPNKYRVWDEQGSMTRNFLEEVKQVPSGKVIIVTGLDELVKKEEVGGLIVAQKAAAIEGKKLEGRVESHFTITLFTQQIKEQSGVKYYFMTNGDGSNTAKSPKGMFDKQLIPNDIKFVIDQAEKYYAS